MVRIAEPQNERSRRTRAAILDAAWRTLEEQGGSGLTMEAVAGRAGVTRRALYLHFTSRSELVSALNDHVRDALDLGSSKQRVFDAPDAVSALEELAAHLVRMHPQFLAVDKVAFRSRDTDPDLAAICDDTLKRWLKSCRQLTQRLADEDRLAEPWTVKTAADMLLALMRDEVIETLAVDRGWPADQHTKLLATLFVRTFVKPAAPRARRRGRGR